MNSYRLLDEDASISNLFFKVLRFLYFYTIRSCLPRAECLTGNTPQETSQKANSFQAQIERQEALMKEKVNFHFGDHIKKWKERNFPWKVSLHLLLIVLVTVQVSAWVHASLALPTSTCFFDYLVALAVL